MTRELIAIGIVPANDKNVKNPKTKKKEGRESKGVSGRYGPLLGRGAAGGVHPCVGSRRHHVWLRGSRSQTAVRAHPRLLPAEPTHTLEHTQLFQRGQWGGERDTLHAYLRSYPYGYCCLWPIGMLPMGPGGPLLYCSAIPLLGPGCMNCSPAGTRQMFRFVFTQSLTDPLRLPPSLTLPHAAEGVLVGLVGTHPAHHFGTAHAGLVALRVGGHGVPSRKRRIPPFGEGIM